MDGLSREPVGIVAADSEKVAPEHGDIVRFARVGYAAVVRGRAVTVRQLIHDRSEWVADHLVIALVLLNDQEDMIVLRKGRGLRVLGEQRRSRCEESEARDDESKHEV